MIINLPIYNAHVVARKHVQLVERVETGECCEALFNELLAHDRNEFNLHLEAQFAANFPPEEPF